MTNVDPVVDPSQEATPLLVMPSGLYDFLKSLVMVILPAISTMYVALATLWGLGNVDKVVGTLVAATTFLGVLLRLAKRAYTKSGAQFDGAIHIVPTEDGDAMKVAIDPAAIANKDSIQLKITQAPPS